MFGCSLKASRLLEKPVCEVRSVLEGSKRQILECVIRMECSLIAEWAAPCEGRGACWGSEVIEAGVCW